MRASIAVLPHTHVHVLFAIELKTPIAICATKRPEQKRTENHRKEKTERWEDIDSYRETEGESERTIMKKAKKRQGKTRR